MKEAATKVIDTLTRGLPWGLPEVVGTVQVHCSRRRLLRSGLEFHVCTINKSGHTKSLETYLMILVCLPYVKGLAESIQKICSPYDIRTIFTSGSTLQRYLFWVKPPMEFNMIKNCVYSIPCSCGKIYKGETGHPLKVRLEEHRKAVV